MSGEDVKANAGLASGTGTAYDAVVELTHRGPGVAGPPSILTAAARTQRSAQTADHVRRACALRTADPKMSAAVIGRRLAREDGHAERPYSARKVRDWLRTSKVGRTA